MTTLEPVESTVELAARAAREPELQRQLKEDPVATLQALAKPLESDPWIYRLVVVVLGLTILFVVSGVFILKVIDNSTGIPDALVAIGSAAVAALAGLLSPFPSRK